MSWLGIRSVGLGERWESRVIAISRSFMSESGRIRGSCVIAGYVGCNGVVEFVDGGDDL